MMKPRNRLIVLVMLFSSNACRFDLPAAHLPVDVLQADTADTAPPVPETSCNYIDDDGDGLVDDGFIYTQATGSLTTVVESTYTGVWWLGKGPTSLAVTWAPGPGTATDVLRLRALDLQGIPISAATTTTSNQPSNYHEPVWLGDRFMAGHTQRQYACGGVASTSCPTELRAFSSDGAPLFDATQVIAATPLVQSGPRVNGEYTLIFPPASSPGDVRIRSFTPTAGAGALDRVLFSIGGGEGIYTIVGFTSGAEIFWVYKTGGAVLSLRVTNLAGDLVRGPTILSTRGSFPDSRGGRQIVVHNGVIHVLFRDASVPATYLGRWDANGVAIGTPTQIASTADSIAMDREGDQLYVLNASGVAPDQVLLTRVALDGTLIQPGTPVALPATETSAALAAVPTGVVVATGDSANQISWARYGCP